MIVTIVKTVGAFGAVASFSRLLELPRRFTIWSGIVGGINWLVYLMTLSCDTGKIMAAFAASLSAAGMSNILARRLKAPVSAFLVPGILPVVPGTSIYNTVYSVIQNDSYNTNYYLLETLQFAGAIAVAIFVADTLFKMLSAKKGTKQRTG